MAVGSEDPSVVTEDDDALIAALTAVMLISLALALVLFYDDFINIK